MPKPKMSPLQKAVVTWLAAHPDTSQRALAEKAGLDSGGMSRIVSGEKPSLAMESAGRLAEAMGLTVEDLLAGRSTASAPSDVRMIDIAAIDPSPHNPRKTIDETELADLAASIAEQGLLQPLIVMNALGAPGRFELIAGHRRLRALEINKAAQALCVVRSGATTSSSRALQIIENLQRVDIAPLEEAQAFADLQDESPTHWTAKAIARAIGKSDRFVSQRLAIARNLAPDLKEKLAAGTLKIEVARVLATAPARLQKEAAKNHWALNDAQQTRSFMHGKAVPVGKNAFKLELYDGEFMEDGDRKWFADAGKFDRLQKKAAEGKLERLRKDWPNAALVGATEINGYVWADDGDYIDTYRLTRTEAKERCDGLSVEDCTALVFLKDHEIKVLKNIVKSEVWREKATPAPDGEDGDGQVGHNPAGGTDFFHARIAEQKAHYEERQALDARLAEGIAGRPDIAKRLVIYGFLGSLNDIETQGVDVRPLAAPWAELLAEFLPATDSNDGYFEPYSPEDADDDRLWAILAAQDEATIDAMLARFLSRSVGATSYSKCSTGLSRAIAAAVGLEIPAKFHPPVPEVAAAAPAEADAA